MTKLVTLTAMILSSLCVSCSTDTNDATTNTTSDPTGTDVGTNIVPEALSYSKASSFALDDFFSNRDYRTELDSDTPVTLQFNGDSITADGEGVEISGSVVTIIAQGTYILTGTLNDGQVIVEMTDSTEKAQIVLDNVTINCSNSAPIYVESADKVFLTMMDGSENHLTSQISDEDSVDGTIFSRDDLTMNGNGTLYLQSTNGHGIVAKDELTITSGTYYIQADGHGMDVNDGIAIADGTFHITAGKDGMHSEDDNTNKGNIFIADGQFYLDVQRDGLDASGFLEIWDGYYDITTCGGSAAAPIKTAIPNNMGGDRTQNTTQQGQMPEGMEQMEGLMPDRNNMQQGQMLEGIEQMEGLMPDNNMQQGQMPEGMDQMEGVMPDRNNMQQGQMLEGMEQVEGIIPDRNNMQQGQMPEGMDQMEGLMPDNNMGQGMMTPQGDMGTTFTAVEDTEDVTNSTKGLKAVGEIRLFGGTFVLDCYDDALHSDTRLEIHEGDYTVSTGDDAIHANWETLIAGGTINILTCFEGIEGQRIDIVGGVINMYAGDDGINAASTSPDPNNSTIYLNISGGDITMNTNAEGDGLDSNGSISISGGNLLISSTTDMRDTSLDSQYTSIITGGTFITTGSNSGTIQNFDTGSTQGSILVILETVETGTVTLTDSKGNTLVNFDPAKEYQAVTISLPEIVVGESYTLTAGNHTENITMDSLAYGSGGRTNSQTSNRR